VEVVSRYMPGVKCLFGLYTGAASPVQSPAHIRIGVAPQPEGQLQAHAWVESQGRIVSGGLKICGAIPTPLEENTMSAIAGIYLLITGQWTAQIWQI